MNWDKLKYFHEVSQDLNVSKAAERLHISQPALSRQINGLESALNRKLFIRTNSGLLLTQDGKRLKKMTDQISGHVREIESLFDQQKNLPIKKLRIETSVTLATMWLPHYLPGFISAHPNLKITLEGVLDESAFLKNPESDVAISTLLTGQKGLWHRYLMTFNIGLYASQDYLNQQGIPRSIDDLKNHKLVGYGAGVFHQYGDALNRVFQLNRESANAFVEINMGMSLVTVASKGLGIIALSGEYPGLSEARLVRVLPEISSPVHVFLIHPSNRQNASKIILLHDYLRHELKDYRPNEAIREFNNGNPFLTA